MDKGMVEQRLEEIRQADVKVKSRVRTIHDLVNAANQKRIALALESGAFTQARWEVHGDISNPMAGVYLQTDESNHPLLFEIMLSEKPGEEEGFDFQLDGYGVTLLIGNSGRELTAMISGCPAPKTPMECEEGAEHLCDFIKKVGLKVYDLSELMDHFMAQEVIVGMIKNVLQVIEKTGH